MYMHGWLRHPGTLQISHADCQASLVWKEKRCDKRKHWRRGPAAEDGCHVKPDKNWWYIPSPLIRWLPSLSNSFQPSESLLWSFLSLWPVRHALEASFWLVQNCPPYVFVFIHVSSLVPGHRIQIQIKLDEGHLFPKTPGKKISLCHQSGRTIWFKCWWRLCLQWARSWFHKISWGRRGSLKAWVTVKRKEQPLASSENQISVLMHPHPGDTWLN